MEAGHRPRASTAVSIGPGLAPAGRAGRAASPGRSRLGRAGSARRGGGSTPRREGSPPAPRRRHSSPGTRTSGLRGMRSKPRTPAGRQPTIRLRITPHISGRSRVVTIDDEPRPFSESTATPSSPTSPGRRGPARRGRQPCGRGSARSRRSGDHAAGLRARDPLRGDRRSGRVREGDARGRLAAHC